MTLVWRPGFSGLTDADAIAYVAAVEAADGQALEFGVGKAINDFIVGCKLDGTWSAIKASCILAGARTLSGALVPLVGTAPTNFNFVAGDYNRKTGLIGNGSTKYLDSNRNNNADPQNSFHLACRATTAASSTSVYMGGGAATNETGASNVGAATSSTTFGRSRNSIGGLGLSALPVGLVAVNRSASNSYFRRANGVQDFRTENSQTPSSFSLAVFAATGGAFPTNARLAFYSIGESLDLALLDTRVSALITAIGAAIP